MQMITIERKATAETALFMSRWRFWYDDRDHRLVLDFWAQYSRPTKRHKWRVEQKYHRLTHRRSTLQAPPSLDETVILEARRRFCQMLRIVAEF
jgi:hypothetical protein